VPAKKKSEDSKRQFNVGEQVRVRLRRGEIVDATIRTIIARENGVKLQVDYGCFAPEFLDSELSVFMRRLRAQGAAGGLGRA
jgi:hypothetical protein